MGDVEHPRRNRGRTGAAREEELAGLRAELARTQAEVERLAAASRAARNERARIRRRIRQLSSALPGREDPPPGARSWSQERAEERERLLQRERAARRAAERRQWEAEQREARFREFGEYIREAFWIADPGFARILYMSPAYEDIWGRSLERLRQGPRLWIDAVHPEDRRRFLAALEELRRRPYSLEHRIIRPDGEIRWVQTRGAPVLDKEGRARRVVGITEDITDRKAAEEAQRLLARVGQALGASIEYEETVRNVARLAVPDLADWCLVDVVERGEVHRLEVASADPRKEALARELRGHVPRPGARAASPEVIRTGRPQLYRELPDSVLRAIARDEEHLRIVRAVGARSAIIVPMVARGRTLGAITFLAAESGRRYGPEDLTFAEDIARRAALAIDNARLFKEAGEARAEAERRAREEMALREAAAAVAATYTVGEVLQQIAESAIEACGADGSAVARVDVERESVEIVAVAGTITLTVGQRWPYPGSLAQRVLERATAEMIPDLGAAERIPAHWLETCRHCSAVVVPLMEGGEQIGALVLLRAPEKPPFRPDEIDRARIFGQLASLAFRRVYLLEETERSRGELARLIEGRSRLMRGFSHDVKNPLGTADGLLALLENGIVDHLTPEQRETVGKARRALRDALELIENLLAFARTEAGEITIERRPVDVRAVAREVAEEYRARVEAKGLTLTIELPERLPPVWTDPARTRQVLGNLVSNAVKYTREGGITIRVALREVHAPRPGRCVAVDVSDTGPGLSEEQQRIIFDEFLRLETAGETTGAGIGLAISKRIARALGGDVSVASKVGKGSTFTLWLPLPDAEPGRAAAAGPGTVPRPHRG